MRIERGKPRYIDSLFFINRNGGPRTGGPSGERLSHRQKLGYTGGFKEQVVEPDFAGQFFDFRHQVVAHGIANEAVTHFGQLLLRTRQDFLLNNQLCFNVDFAHIVDNNGYSKALLVVLHVVEQGCLAGPIKPLSTVSDVFS